MDRDEKNVSVVPVLRAFLMGTFFGVLVMTFPYTTTLCERRDISGNKECTILICSDKETFAHSSSKILNHKASTA